MTSQQRGAPAPTQDFEYDVAFSFLAADEALVDDLNRRVKERLKTFIYSEHQQKLAGGDGSKGFYEVFRRKSRVVVVLLRPGWGNAGFTSVERTAIEDRALSKGGWEFALFIVVQKPVELPEHYPTARLWYDLDRFDVSGAAAVIEERVRACGLELPAESALEHAARLARARELVERRNAFRELPTAITSAFESFEAMFAEIVRLIEKISAEVGGSVEYKVRENGQRRHNLLYNEFMVFGQGGVMLVRWEHNYANTLRESQLTVSFWDGMPRFATQPDRDRGPSTIAAERVFDFQLLRPGVTGWIERKSGDFFDPPSLADSVLQSLMAAEAHGLRKTHR